MISQQLPHFGNRYDSWLRLKIEEMHWLQFSPFYDTVNKVVSPTIFA